MVCVRLYIYYTKPPDHLWQFHAVVQSAQVLQIFCANLQNRCTEGKNVLTNTEGCDII